MKYKHVKILCVSALLLALCAPGRAEARGAGPQPDVLEATLRRMRERLDSLRDYRCLYASFAVKGTRREDTVMKYHYKKPGWIRAEIVDGEHMGTALIAREGKVRAKPKGILSLFVFTYPADHPRVTDIRGNRLEETSWDYFVSEHIRNLGLMTLLSERRETLDSREVLVLEVASRDPARTRGIAREILWVCAAEDILLRFEMYDSKDRLVQTARFTEIVLNPGFADSLFTRFDKR